MRLPIALLLAAGSAAQATEWTYDFGTATGNYTTNAASTTFLPQAPAGEDRVRVGGGAGSFVLTDSVTAGVGSGSALVITASSSTSVNKFSVYDYATSKTYALSFSTALSGSSGIFQLLIGDGAIYSDNNSATFAQVATGIQFQLGASSITTQYRNASGWTSTGLTTTGIVSGTELDFQIYGNNGLAAVDYYLGTTAYSLSNGTWDIWLNGQRIGAGLSKAGLAANANIDSFAIFGLSSTGNVGKMAIDDIVYANSLPVLVSSPPPASGTGLYWAGSSGSGGAGTWSASSATFATDATFAETNLEIGTGTVVFAGASGGTVTIDGGVSVASGLRFSTTGYTLSSSTLTLAGANAAANALTVDADVTATIGSVVDGTTGLTKAGSGTLVLTGANTYTGGTAVSAGKLTVSTASLSGNVANSGNVTFDQASDATYAGAVTGTGSLTKEGAGNLTLTGANAHTGGTTISTGTLTVSTASLSGAVTNNAALAFNQASDGTYAGTITGTGSLTKSGAGNLTLSGANNYSGGTTISTGILTGSSSSIAGAVTNNAALVFDQAAVGTYAGTITGSGSVTKSGAGNLTLTGANAHTGGTTISAGTLTVSSSSISGAIANNAALVFDQASAGTYAGVISGAGTLAKTGVGALTLSGNSSSFSGATTISAGSVVASHAAALGSSAVTVNGGTLTATAGLTVANALVVGVGSSLTPNVLIAGWDFQTTTNGGTLILAAPNTPKVLVANFGSGALYLDGANGSSSWTSSSTVSLNQLAAFAGTSSVNLADGFATATSAGSLSILNQSANGNSIVMALNLAGYEDLSVSYAAQRTDQGFNTHTWEYSADGSTWLPYQVANGLASSFAVVSLGTLSAVNDDATVWLRLTVTGASSETGNNRIDNLQVRGSSVGPAGGSGSLGLLEAGAATFSGNVTLHGAATLTAAADATATFSGVLSGAGSVTKTGLGTVVLSSANTFEGGVTISAGTLEIGNIASLGTGVVTVSGGVLDLADLAPTNIINLAGGELARASTWGSTGSVQLSGSAGSDIINALPTAEVTIAAGANVDLTGVTKDIVFEGGDLTNLAGYVGKVKVKGNLDVSAGDTSGEIEVDAGGTLNFGNRQSNRAIKYKGGAIAGSNFTGTVEVDSSAGAVSLTSDIGAGNVRLGNGSSASIQAGFNRDLRLESGATLSGLNNYSGELTIAASTFSTSGITTSATIAIESGTTLTGTGTVGSVVQVAGSILAPGNSPGILNVTGTHVLAGGAAMEVEFYDLATSQVRGTAYDGVTAGTLDLSGLTTANPYTLELVSLSGLPSTQGALAGFDVTQSYIFDIFLYTTITLPGTYTGSMSDYFLVDVSQFDDATGSPVGLGGFSVFQNTGTNSIQLLYTPIPEPSTYGLILGGLALAGAALRRRRKQAV